MITLLQAVFMRMLIGHVIVDFYLQPDRRVEQKRAKGWKSRELYIHSFISAAFVFLFTGIYSAYWIFGLVFLSHVLIDRAKVFFEQKYDGCMVHIGDQIAHIVILLVITLMLQSIVSQLDIEHIPGLLSNPALLAVIIAYLLILTPSGIFIKKLIQPFKPHSQQSENNSVKLAEAGRKIGYLERVLVLTFVLLQQYAAIGFLITAKSIFRFKDDERHLVEYYLFGTFLSMTIVILIGLVVVFLLDVMWVKSVEAIMSFLGAFSY